MASEPTRTLLPILPLGRDAVLLPGTTLRVPTAGRASVRPLLNAAYSKSAAEIGCVPLCSPLLSPEGQSLLEDSDTKFRKTAERLANPDGAGEKDLFVYGVSAKVVGLHGKRVNELALVVEGVRRFRVERFTQFKPYVECEVTPLGEELIDASDTEALTLFQQLKQASREILAIVRVSSMLPGSTGSMSSLAARRLDMYVARKDFSEAGQLCDLMASVVSSTFEERLQILAALDVRQRMEKVIEILKKQMDGMQGSVKITTFSTDTPMSSNNNTPDRKDAILRAFSNMKVGPPGGFGNGLGGGGGGGEADSEKDELDELKQKLDDARLPPEGQKVAEKELKRLRKMNPSGAEYGVCRTYLETLAEIPWSVSTEDKLGRDTLKLARKQLDEDHFGLDKIKKRLLEYLAVLKLKQAINADVEARIKRIEDDSATSKEAESEPQISLLRSKHQVDKSPILLLVGPPGTGKTSLAKSVATALGRKFHRISLGGVRDEAEIRGHRRTYVAAMPGLIVNGLKKVGVNNPVFLLDEIDKVGMANFHGDPSAAMLEVLDPEQNHTFVDHYVNTPLDLSKVLFIATANSLDTIPAPLLDRMETISLSGYTTIEKRHIATRHLVPKQVAANGMADADLQIEDAALNAIIASYTREAGVRSLEREIGAVCRAKAVQFSDSRDSPERSEASAGSDSSAASSASEGTSDSSSIPTTNPPSSLPQQYQPLVTEPDLESILGPPRFEEELAASTSTPGIVTGLVAYAGGGYGSILFVEVADMPGGSGRVQLTGKLGEVLKESVEVALTWVKSHSFELGLTATQTEDIMASRSIHVHCPSGAVPKDGPSAGVAHAVALVSLFAGKPVRPDLAMTGEVSLRGRVLPVGGIKEKLLGAMRAGVREVMLPKANEREIKDLPVEVKEGLRIHRIENVWEAIRTVWPGSWEGSTGWGESRL